MKNITLQVRVVGKKLSVCFLAMLVGSFFESAVSFSASTEMLANDSLKTTSDERFGPCQTCPPASSASKDGSGQCVTADGSKLNCPNPVKICKTCAAIDHVPNNRGSCSHPTDPTKELACDDSGFVIRAVPLTGTLAITPSTPINVTKLSCGSCPEGFFPNERGSCSNRSILTLELPCSEGESSTWIASCATMTDLVKAFGICRPDIRGSTESSGLFQQTLSTDGELTLKNLESEAQKGALELHKLPASDLNKIQRNGRNTTRAALFALITKLFYKPQSARTEGEKNLVTNYESLTRDFHVLATRYAKAEYNKWAANKCGYVAPFEPKYTPDPAFCSKASGSIGHIFADIAPPTLQDFLNYGVNLAYQRFNLADKGSGGVTEGMAKSTLGWIGFGSVLGTAALTGALMQVVSAFSIFSGYLGIAIPVKGLTVTLIGGPVISTTTGLGSYVSSALGLSSAASSSFTAFALAVAGPAIVILTAIITGIMRGITVFTEASIPGQLDQAILDAEKEKTPIETALNSTDESVKNNALAELNLVLTYSTLPETRNPIPVPAPSESDPKFQIKDEKENMLQANASFISFKSSTKLSQQGIAHLSGGWFVAQYAGANPSGKELSLFLTYVDWDNNLKSAERFGQYFNIVSLDAKPASSQVTKSIKYLDENGQKREALIAK